MKPILVGIPTLNEAKNIEPMVARLGKLPLPLELLFVDDNSSDGTAEILDRIARGNPSVRVLHRSGVPGIGSAHQAILQYAYDGGYEKLITMDCDFSHQPEDLPRLLEEPSQKPVVVGSRFLDAESLADWNPKRKFLTHLGHWLTFRFLGLPMDATGAFRLYRLNRIPQKLWRKVQSPGYAFFFESLVILHRHGIECAEISIRLPKRVYGESKLNFRQALRSLATLLQLTLFSGSSKNSDNNAEGWDQYWKAGASKNRNWYACLASLYRKIFIVRRLNRILEKYFRKGAHIYHVGCGGGEVDERTIRSFRIVAVDISPEARKLYHHNHPGAEIRNGDILREPLSPCLEGIYSLGLVEHFSKQEIVTILRNMVQSVSPGGKILIFWPHRRAPSVYFLRFVSWLRDRLGLDEPLHPPEPSLLRSRKEAEQVAAEAGCRILTYEFGAEDLWIQAAMVLQEQGSEIGGSGKFHFDKPGHSRKGSAH